MCFGGGLQLLQDAIIQIPNENVGHRPLLDMWYHYDTTFWSQWRLAVVIVKPETRHRLAPTRISTVLDVEKPAVPPLTGRCFFEEVIRENLDIGRPTQMQLIFDRRVTRQTPGSFRTRLRSAICPHYG